MSKATKRKHVTKEVLEDFVLPELGQQIVQVSNHECHSDNFEKFLMCAADVFETDSSVNYFTTR